MSFPRYPEYKDSGVEWLGDVPVHWSVQPAKYGISTKSGGQATKNTVSSEPGDDLFPAFSASGQDIWMEEYEFEGPAVVLSAVGARCGKTFKAGGRWGVVANTHCLFPRAGFSRDFLWYLTNRESWWERGGTAQPFVKVSETLARKWVFPPTGEQEAIATFLDRETTKIDTLVAEQEKLIALLQEKRQAVISHAVTKGLDPTVPMKDSGVEWLGEVPGHWGVGGLTRFIGPVVDYRGRTPTKVDEGIFLVTARNIRDGRIDYEASEEFVDPDSAASLLARGKPEIDDLLFTMEAPLGQVALIDRTDIALAQRVVKFRGVPSLMRNSYLLYWLMSTGCQSRLETLATGSTALGIKASKLGMIECLAPPLDEQDSIVALIKHETTKLDTLMAEARTAITLLQERRTALISAAVTGQIDVRGLAGGENAPDSIASSAYPASAGA